MMTLVYLIADFLCVCLCVPRDLVEDDAGHRNSLLVVEEVDGEVGMLEEKVVVGVPSM